MHFFCSKYIHNYREKVIILWSFFYKTYIFLVIFLYNLYIFVWLQHSSLANTVFALDPRKVVVLFIWENPLPGTLGLLVCEHIFISPQSEYGWL